MQYEYATRLNQTGPLVHKRRVPGGEWQTYTPTFDHITEEDRVEYRRLAKEHILLRMKPATRRFQ